MPVRTRPIWHFLVLCLGIVAMAACLGCDTICDLEIKTATLPDGTVGEEYDFTLDGKCEDRWRVESGVIPPGLTFSSSGRVQGTPSTAGEYQFVITVDKFPENSNSTNPSSSLSKGMSITIAAGSGG